ncbi:MAG: L,D-transpeptidase [Prevotella sp.]|jgi:lipoprotein-anchoring transpeptidase ErfK/SrfK|nr:L,D-transpeptidase [Prevotella sp.]
MKIKRPNILQIITAIVIVLPYLGMFGIYRWYNAKADKIENARFILISKQEMRLSVYDYKGDELCKFPVACGANFGNKSAKGDMKTPEGVFRITEIQNSGNWSHNFNDGNGEIAGAYGPYFIRLHVPGHSGIGIHGTHDPKSMEKRVTEGCIRLTNENLLKLVEYVHSGMAVVITASTEDIIKSNN